MLSASIVALLNWFTQPELKLLLLQNFVQKFEAV